MKKIAIVLVTLFLPAVTFAQTAVKTTYINSILEAVKGIVSFLVPLIISIAFLYFLYGVIKYVIAGSPEDRAGARNIMIYGIIGLAVMVSVWGIVRVLQTTFGVENNTTIKVPGLPTY